MTELITRLANPPATTPTLSGTVRENRATRPVDIRVQLIIEFMQSNLEKRMVPGELARLIGLSIHGFAIFLPLKLECLLRSACGGCG